MRHLFDKSVIERKFQHDDMVMYQNAMSKEKGKHGKFDPLWLAPFIILANYGEDSYFIKQLTREILELLVHGQFLKLYFS